MNCILNKQSTIWISNQFDSKAIPALNNDKKKLGCVPEKDNVVFFRYMDAGKILKTKNANIEGKRSWTKVIIGINPVDLKERRISF